MTTSPRPRRLATIDVKPGAAMESQSGLQMLKPRIYGAYEEGWTGSGMRTGGFCRDSAMRPSMGCRRPRSESQ